MNPITRFATLTLSPAIDVTVDIDGELSMGGVHSVRSEVCTPGGKGVNVARQLALNGCPVTAGVLLGADQAPLFESALASAGIDVRCITVDHPTRRNTMVVDRRGHELKLNHVAFPDLAFDWERVRSLVSDLMDQADVVVLSGSLPGMFPADTYARLVDLVKRTGRAVVVDAAGPVAAEATASVPALVKPNRAELAALVGRELGDGADFVAAAREIARPDMSVLASDGSTGACLAAGEDLWFASAPPVVPLDTTGAGDVLLGQFCADYLGRPRGGDVEHALRRAVAAGSACVEVRGPALSNLDRVDELAGLVEVSEG